MKPLLFTEEDFDAVEKEIEQATELMLLAGRIEDEASGLTGPSEGIFDFDEEHEDAVFVTLCAEDLAIEEHCFEEPAVLFPEPESPEDRLHGASTDSPSRDGSLKWMALCLGAAVVSALGIGSLTGDMGSPTLWLGSSTIVIALLLLIGRFGKSAPAGAYAGAVGACLYNAGMVVGAGEINGDLMGVALFAGAGAFVVAGSLKALGASGITV